MMLGLRTSPGMVGRQPMHSIWVWGGEGEA